LYINTSTLAASSFVASLFRRFSIISKVRRLLRSFVAFRHHRAPSYFFRHSSSVALGNNPELNTLVGQDTVVEQGNGAVSRVTGCLFQRLPHPLKPLLKSLPVVNSLEFEKLLDFLIIVLKIRRLGQILDWQLFEVLYPFCREPLAERLLSARAQNKKFERSHELVLEYFIPRRIYQQLRQERFSRLQGEN
jgi:hypothetical protein